uniref:Macrophage-expressed gene 1 protein n=1 Tax=Mesocestoides corti TaxID=53468 RepID=A0A5K3FS21_MESCO
MSYILFALLTLFDFATGEFQSRNHSELNLKTNSCVLKPGQKLLSVLPGNGWDNLVNEERGLTTNRERYELCRVSSDGEYLIPDDMNIEPIRSSQIELSSEVFSHFTNYTTLTAYSMNTATGVNFHLASISGDFSFEKESVRKAENSHDGLTVRSQLRHRWYTVHQLPDSQLHPRFRNRLLDVAAHIERSNITAADGISYFGSSDVEDLVGSRNGRRKSDSSKRAVFRVADSLSAAYLADLIVRDFGTHSVVAIEAGALVAKIDSLSSSTRKMTNNEKLGFETAASAAFAGFFSLKTSAKFGDSEKLVENYNSKVASSMVLSHGGPSLKASELNLTNWEMGLEDKLVAIDRRGRPIYDLITPRALPELSESLIFRLVGVVKAAVERYYAANSIVGCLDPLSIFYDNAANVAADHCEDTPFHDTTADSETAQLPFGGIYTTCEGPQDLCSHYIIPNPATGNTSCPDGYWSTKLLPPQVRSCAVNCQNQGVFQQPDCVHECAVTLSYWCAVNPMTNNTKKELGFLFGGLYTDTSTNPITNAQTCPLYYEPLQLGRRIRVCVSTDREFGRRYSLAFGGFYACQSGNPLYDVLSLNTTTWQKVQQEKRKFFGDPKNTPVDELARGNDNGENSPLVWPKQCPNGYTSHMAAIEDTCLVNYCIPANSLKTVKERQLKRPPFIQLPEFVDSAVGKEFEEAYNGPLRLVDASSGRVYQRDHGDWVMESREDERTSNITSVIQICAAVMGSVVLVIVLAVIILYVNKRFDCRRRDPCNQEGVMAT